MKRPLLFTLVLFIVVLSCGEKRARWNIDRLKSEDREARFDACRNLLLIGKPAVEPLIQVLQTSDERSRFIAAQLLGKIGDHRAVEPLIDALKNNSVAVCEVAVVALGKLMDRRCVSPLIECLHENPAPSIRAKTAEALGILRTVETEEALVKALQDSSAEVRKNALIALNSFMDSRLNMLFFKMTEDPDGDVRYIAVQILRHAKFSDALNRFIELLDDDVPGVRQEAAYALGEIGNKKAVAPLLNMLVEQGNNEADQKAAREALKKLTGTEYKVVD